MIKLAGLAELADATDLKSVDGKTIVRVRFSHPAPKIMILEFNPAKLILYGDIERNPYPMWTKENADWAREDDKRLMLIALERYVMILNYMKHTPSHSTKMIYHGFYDESPFYKAIKNRK